MRLLLGLGYFPHPALTGHNLDKQLKKKCQSLIEALSKMFRYYDTFWIQDIVNLVFTIRNYNQSLDLLVQYVD